MASPIQKYCPRCFKLEVDIDECPMTSLPGFICPEPVKEDPKRDILIVCDPCEKRMMIPVGDLMKGIPQDRKPSPCRRDKCEACVVRPAAAESQPAKATQDEAPKG
jgi:hypothetical protein